MPATDCHHQDATDTGRTCSHLLDTADLNQVDHYLSPDQEWIADNGWVWGAAGIVTSWSPRWWLEENVWESEDGPSRRRFVQRWYYWDGRDRASLCGMTWLSPLRDFAPSDGDSDGDDLSARALLALGVE
jgi:hypothetical protein